VDDPTSQDHVMAARYLDELNKHADKEDNLHSKTLIPNYRVASRVVFSSIQLVIPMKDAPLVGGECLLVYSSLSYSPFPPNTHVNTTLL
jgi:hypothetical protein